MLPSGIECVALDPLDKVLHTTPDTNATAMTTTTTINMVVRTRPLDGSGNVSAIATAQVALDGESPTTIRLALVKDRWRVVPDPPRGPR